MSKQRYLFLFIAALFLFTTAVTKASAASITVQNAGFEAIVLGNQGWVTAADHWTVIGNAGTFNPGSGDMPQGLAPEGQNIAFAANGSLYQELDAVLTQGTTYTLSMYVIKRLQTGYQGVPYLIELMAGDTVIAQDNNSLNLGPGTWDISTIDFTADAGNPLLGQNLGIRLSGAAQTNFDDVRLNASTVPVPGAIWLLGAGLIGTCALGRRQHRRF